MGTIQQQQQLNILKPDVIIPTLAVKIDLADYSMLLL